MYREKRKGRIWWILGGVLASALALYLVLGPAARSAARAIEEQSAVSVKDAVMRSAVQCYAVEGAYPNSVEYLEEHYGLVINHDRYIVSYEAYASNLAPNVKVLVIGDNGAATSAGSGGNLR